MTKVLENRLIEEFKKNAGEISNQIAAKQREQRQIDVEIKNVIEEEIRLAKIRAEKYHRCAAPNRSMAG